MRQLAMLSFLLLTILGASPLGAQAQWRARGRALTKDGKPWSKAQVVFVERLPKGFDRAPVKPHVVRATADERGEVSARLTSGAEYRAWAFEELAAQADEPRRYHASAWIDVHAGRRFELREAATGMRTRIQLVGHGQAFDPGKLRVHLLGSQSITVLELDDAGKVELPMTPGWPRIRVVDTEGRVVVARRKVNVDSELRRRSWRAARKKWSELDGKRRTLTLEPAPVDTELVQLEPLSSFLVRVVTYKDGKKLPVAGARLILGDFGVASLGGVTDAEGWASCKSALLPRVRAKGLPILRLECHAKGYASRQAQCVVALITDEKPAPKLPGMIEIRGAKDEAKRRKEGKPHIEFELVAAAPVRGRLLLDGKLFGGARLRVLRKIQEQRAKQQVRFAMSGISHSAETIVSAEDGSFEVPGLRRGESFEVVAHLDRRLLAAIPEQRWPAPVAIVAVAQAPAKGQLELGDLDLAKLPLLEIQAREANGDPVNRARVFVWARPGQARWLTLRSSRLGRLNLICAKTSVLNLGMQASGRKVRLATQVPPKDAAVQLRLPAAVVLRGRVVNENGEAIPGAYVYSNLTRQRNDANDPLSDSPTTRRVRAKDGGIFSLTYSKGAQVSVYAYWRDGKRRVRSQKLQLTLHEDVKNAVLTLDGVKPKKK